MTTARSTRVGALITTLGGGLALGLSGLLPAQICLLALVLTLTVGVLVPRWAPELLRDSPRRTALAVLVLALLVLTTALSGPGALMAGGSQGRLGTAVGELALPAGVPIGLLAALAAGGLVAVASELADRRGVQSALVLGTAVLGLASVAGPGRQLLPVMLFGWPAALFTLTQLAGAPGVDSPPVMNRSAHPGSTGSAGLTGLTGSTGRRFRWHVLPVLAAITLSCALLAGAGLSGLIGAAGRGGGGGLAGRGFGTGSNRSASGYLGGSMDLSARGALGGQSLYQVTANSPRLWRAGTLDLYTGRGWLATLTSGGLPQVVAGAGGRIGVVQRAGSYATAAGPARTDQVRPLLNGQTEVLAPGQVLGLVSPELAGGSAFSAPGDRLTVTDRRGAGLSRYQVQSQGLPMLGEPGWDRPAASSGDPLTDPPDPRWTALPRGLPDRVRQLGIGLVAAAPSRPAAVQAIERELGRRITYTLDSPVPPAGADAVDDVLFTSHSGFCEQFASAEVVLLRAAGVPARMAVGFSGGEAGDNGLRTLHRSDAHAWVEVWIRGVGWVDSDPTPAAAATSTPWWRTSWAHLRGTLERPITWGLVVLVLLGSAVAAGLLRRRRRRARGPGIDGPGRPIDPELAAAFDRLEADLTHRGTGRRPNETVAALARRLPSEPVRQALATLERALYGPEPPTRPECLAAAAAIDRSLEGPARAG